MHQPIVKESHFGSVVAVGLSKKMALRSAGFTAAQQAGKPADMPQFNAPPRISRKRHRHLLF
jgi:hypothetical protein